MSEYMSFVNHETLAKAIDAFHSRKITNQQFKLVAKLIFLEAKLRSEIVKIPDNNETVSERTLAACEPICAEIASVRKSLLYHERDNR